MPLYPKKLILSLQPPARILLSYEPLVLPERCVIASTPVEANDAPWPAMADVLSDRDSGEFVGLTFCVPWEEEQTTARRLAARLDPRVIRYNDMSTRELREPYGRQADTEHWFEIFWKSARALKMELAQLMNGQYWWWYALEGAWDDVKPVVAISLRYVDETAVNHGLSFPPQIDLPPLEVRCE